MSRAFVKESDGADGEELPELRVSPHRNLVTPVGRDLIEKMVDRLQSALTEAREASDRAAVNQNQRDLRYWTERRRTAEVIAPSEASPRLRFGSTVTLKGHDGQRIKYQIVGEDEADPANGKISYVSPIAKSLIGAAVGDVVTLVDGDAEIREIG